MPPLEPLKTAIVPGSHDAPLGRFLGLDLRAEMEYSDFNDVHARLRLGDTAIMLIGGERTPTRTPPIL